MIIIHIIFLLCFIMSIAVQYNDPDGFIWMIIYLVPLAFSILGILKRYTPIAFPVSTGFLVAAAIIMPWSHLGMLPQYLSEHGMTSLESEWSREAVGLAICAVYLDFLGMVWLIQYKKTQNTDAIPLAGEEATVDSE